MTTDPDQGGRKGNPLAKWGPLALIVVLLVAVGAFVVAGGGDDDSDEDGAAPEAGELAEGAPEPTGQMPITHAEAQEAGTPNAADSRVDRHNNAVGQAYGAAHADELAGGSVNAALGVLAGVALEKLAADELLLVNDH